MPFAKGQSGNPGGRPKEVGEVRALARQHTAQAVATLATIMRSRKAKGSERVAAAVALLDRGYGRPQQSITADVNVGLSAILESLPVKSRPHKSVDS